MVEHVCPNGCDPNKKMIINDVSIWEGRPVRKQKRLGPSWVGYKSKKIYSCSTWPEYVVLMLRVVVLLLVVLSVTVA